ncbi:vitamin B12 ABC transporter ATP-binding protein BtuD [Entomohabitans teleogrylli]|uniref:vitamin B12 ABC transporter ATP-binding protein BtuD n=1 Tax=Entomohabitans teleogrylli TaxID=1384589 RepID=UPI00073D7AF8|nr:vitamin B12 ABC transporter ATP-binding protein BtuD [Entomohabitans teleogrylli]
MLLDLRNIGVSGRLGPINAQVRPGELVHLVGPNGAGKSTLLARMAGMADGEGEARLDGRPLDDWSGTALARRRAFLIQHQAPPFAMPVWHFLRLHMPPDSDDAPLLAQAEALWLSDKLTRPVNHLSGGEWQRVRLAAVLLQIHPRCHSQGGLLLLDEPMNSLDVAQQAALDRQLQGLCAAGIAVVMSSHDLNHTLRHADRVWLLRGGKMVAQGAADEVLTAHNLQQAYHIAFRRVAVDGHNMLIASP